MNANDIERYLSLVGEELQAMGVREPIQLLLVGGGYMLTQVHNRAATGDVDAVWLYPEIYSGSEIYRLFKAAVQFIADDEGLDGSWLSIDVGGFVRAIGPLPQRRLWKKFAVVHVYLPPLDFILALKLVTAREKDQNDIQALFEVLEINTRHKAQRILDTYVKQEIQADNHVPAKLEAFFAWEQLCRDSR